MSQLRVVLDGQVFGIPISAVREVISLGSLTPVPTAPPEVCGVMQLRGEVLPVIDPSMHVRTMCGRMGAPGAADSSSIQLPRPGVPLVVVAVDEAVLALLVEAIDTAQGTADVPLFDVRGLLAQLQLL